MFFSFIDGSLMETYAKIRLCALAGKGGEQTYGRCSDIHIGKHNVGILDPGGQPEMRRQRQLNVDQHVIHVTMSPPKLAVDVVVLFIGVGPVKG